MPHGLPRPIIMVVGDIRARRRFTKWLASHPEIDLGEMDTTAYMDKFTVGLSDTTPVEALDILGLRAAANALSKLTKE